MTTIRAALFTALALALSAPAFADGFVVDIHGNYTTNTRVGEVKASANGQNTSALANVGGVQGFKQ